MSLIPGIAGQATVLLDGVKVDSILENTLNNGVQIKVNMKCQQSESHKDKK
jgi:hypothetical protein